MRPDSSFVAHEAITVSSVSIGLTTATIAGRSVALITCEAAVVRFTLDGTAPTATVGHVLNPDDVLTLDSPDQLQKVRFIRRNAVDATLRCSYGR